MSKIIVTSARHNIVSSNQSLPKEKVTMTATTKATRTTSQAAHLTKEGIVCDVSGVKGIEKLHVNGRRANQRFLPIVGTENLELAVSVPGGHVINDVLVIPQDLYTDPALWQTFDSASGLGSTAYCKLEAESNGVPVKLTIRQYTKNLEAIAVAQQMKALAAGQPGAKVLATPKTAPVKTAPVKATVKLNQPAVSKATQTAPVQQSLFSDEQIQALARAIATLIGQSR